MNFDDLPDTSSAAAELGTTIHDLAAQRLRGQYPAGIPDEQEDIIREYEEFIDGIEGNVIEIEHRLYFNDDLFGTADCIIINGQRAHIIDLKTGGVQVFAEDNEQMLTYAFMLACQHPELQEFCLHIAQPGNYNSWLTSRASVDAFGERVRARMAEGPSTEYVPSEGACKWCKGRSTCKARHDHNVAIYGSEFPVIPTVMTHEQMARAVFHSRQIVKWLEEVEAHYLELVIAGFAPIGEGLELTTTTTSRRWTETAAEALEAAGVEPYKRVLIGIGEAEKILGKNHEVFQHTEKPAGVPTIKKLKRPAKQLRLPST